MRNLQRVLLVLLPSILFAVAIYFYFQKPKPTEEPEPPAEGPARLVVLISFDQLRGDYLDRWSGLYGPDGFEKMKRDGAWYADAHLPYANTFTGPGHATLGTGVPPAVHGIISNDWYDRAAKRSFESVQSPRHARVPGGKPESGAFSPERLLVETIGDNLKAARPRNSKVFSMSIKARSATLMAGKNANGVYCFDEGKGEFYTSDYYTDRVPPWVDEFNKSKVVDRWFDATWEHLLNPATYLGSVGPDDRVGESKSRVFPHVLKRGEKPAKAYYEAMLSSPYGNELLWEFAKTCIAAEKLGQGNGSHMLCISFSSNDRIGHGWGPDSHEVMDMTLRSDRIIAEMIRHLDSVVGTGRYAIFISADHGICPFPEVYSQERPTAERYSPNSEIGDLGTELDMSFGPIGNTPSAWFNSLGFPEIYLNRTLIKAKKLSQDDVELFCARWVAGRPGILNSYTRKEIEGPPLADPVSRRVQLSFHPQRSGDVFMVGKPYWLPVGRISTGTTHGSPHSYDTHIPVLMYGAGIPAISRQDREVSSLIMTPTIYHSLGLTPPPYLYEKLPDEIAKKPVPPEPANGR